jgi:hypothetical protein
LDVELLRGQGDHIKPIVTGSMMKAKSGIILEKVAFLQTYTLQVIDTLINLFFDRFVAGI